MQSGLTGMFVVLERLCFDSKMFKNTRSKLVLARDKLHASN
jgi:hypothetical protein